MLQLIWREDNVSSFMHTLFSTIKLKTTFLLRWLSLAGIFEKLTDWKLLKQFWKPLEPSGF